MTDLANATSKCSHPYCGVQDFLPVTCEFCRNVYCDAHFRPRDHDCDHQSLADRQDVRAEVCEMCAHTVKYTPGDASTAQLAVKQAFERHRNSGECVAFQNRNKTFQASPTHCAVKDCRETLTLSNKLQCKLCHQWTCLGHRLQQDHDCKGIKGGSRTNGILDLLGYLKSKLTLE